ncbi:phosphatase PAP2 family protein [bacterium]|nr:phosphatase PAP2 family protein [bacterium]
MQHPSPYEKKAYPWGLIGLILLFPLIMIPLATVDYEVTIFFYHHKHKLFGELMKRTVFQGFKFGASDPAIFFQIIMACFYFCYSPKRKQNSYHYYRPFLGYVIFSSLVTGLGLVHSVKWILGRARPHLVFADKLPYSQWFEFGPHFVSDGIFYGSFPSGHTATVFLLITVSYWLIGNPQASRNSKIFGWVWGVLIIILTIMMAIGRCMTAHHWLSDSVGVTLMVLVSIHLNYYYILKIPQQVEYFSRQGTYVPLPRYWEFGLLWRLFFIAMGFMGVVIGIRSVVIGKAPGLILMVLPAVIMVFYLVRRVRQVYRNSMIQFEDRG